MAPNAVWFHSRFVEKDMKTFFWRSNQKKVFIIFVGDNLSAKIAHKRFGQVWGNSDKIPSHPQKFACSYTYDEKAPPSPLLPL